MRRAAPWFLLLAVVLAATFWIGNEASDRERGSGTLERPASPPELATGRPALPARATDVSEEPQPAGAAETVRVTVTDEAGTPVPRARLRVTRRSGRKWEAFEIDVVAGEAVFTASASRRPVHVWVFDPCGEDGLPLNLQSDMRRNVRRSGREVRFTLQRGREVSGVVLRDDGEPGAGLPVTATYSGGGEAGNVATTDRQGRFALRGLPGHELEVQILRGVGWIPREPVRLCEDDTTVEFVVTRARDIEILVLDADEAPVAHALVTLEWRLRPYDVRRRGRTGEDGRFHALDFPVRAGCRLVVDPTSCDPPLPTVSTSKQTPPSDQIIVHVPPAAYIRGRVLTPGRMPCAKARVEASAVGADGEHATTAGEDGQFEIGPLKAGEYRVRISSAHPDTLLPPTRTVTAPISALELTYVRPMSVRGRVLGAEPNNAFVMWIDEHGHSEFTRVGPDGSFVIHRVRPGPGALSVGEQRRDCRAFLMGLDPEDGPFEVDLGECLDVAGRLEDLRHEPRERVWISIRRGAFESGVTLERDGKFRSPCLLPGNYELEVCDGHGPLASKTVRAGAQGVVLTFKRD